MKEDLWSLPRRPFRPLKWACLPMRPPAPTSPINWTAEDPSIWLCLFTLDVHSNMIFLNRQTKQKSLFCINSHLSNSLLPPLPQSGPHCQLSGDGQCLRYISSLIKLGDYCGKFNKACHLGRRCIPSCHVVGTAAHMLCYMCREQRRKQGNPLRGGRGFKQYIFATLIYQEHILRLVYWFLEMIFGHKG